MGFLRKLTEEYFSLDYFRQFVTNPAFKDLAPVYIGDSALGIYKQWKCEREHKGIKTIDELADFAAQLITGGIQSFVK